MMKTTIARLDDTKLRLDVEVPEHVLKDAMDATLQYMGGQLNIRAFARQGAAPGRTRSARP